MIEIMNKVKELYGILLTKERKFKTENELLANKTRKVGDDQRRADDRMLKLDVREKEIKKVEDIIKLTDECADAYRNLTVTKKQFNKDMATFEESKIKARADIQSVREELHAKKQKLEKQQKKLNEDKKTYKDEVMKSINQSLKEKGIEL